MLQNLFESGHIAFLIIAMMAAEAVFFRNRPAMLAGLAAGACLALALRAALLDQGWMTIAAYLAASLVFHAAEIWQWLRMDRKARP